MAAAPIRLQTYVDCAGNCINDSDGDGVCDEEEVPGCDDEGACNFDSNCHGR